MTWIERRTTGDLLILVISLTVCGAVLLGILILGTIAVVRPGTDTSGAAATIAGVINVLIGLLAGFLAGKTDLTIGRDRVELKREPDPDSDVVETDEQPDHV